VGAKALQERAGEVAHCRLREVELGTDVPGALARGEQLQHLELPPRSLRGDRPREASPRPQGCPYAHGAAGVLHKSAGMDEIIDAVRRLNAGETLLPLENIVELLRFAGARKEEEYEAQQTIARLTDRELEVLEALAEGLDAQQIAGRLHISARTERNHVASILAKLGVHSRLQALVFAARHGVVEIGGPQADEGHGI
jgi:DNA-binding CsgD family transcriptional regulator